MLPSVGRLAGALADPLQREFVWNSLLKEFSYTHRLENCLGYPQVVELETTNHCPFRCVMCPRTYAMTRDRGHMDLGLFREIIDQLRPAWQVERLGRRPVIRLLHYGEPTVYPHFAESIEHCHRRGLTVSISSNPAIWSEQRIEEMLDCGLDDLTIMCDGLDDETSMAVRGRAASFQRGERAILELARRKVQRGLSAPRICIAMIRQPRNAHQWAAFKRHWDGIPGIDSVYLGFFSVFDGRVPEINALAGQLREQAPDQAQHVARQRMLAQFPCYYPWHSVCIAWDGRVLPCCRDYDASFVLGDLKRQTLARIWNGPAARALRREFNLGRIRTPMCASCPEPSLEVGLPGAFYPVARWLRRLGGGRLPGVTRQLGDAPPDLTGTQNHSREGFHRPQQAAPRSPVPSQQPQETEDFVSV